MNNGTMRRASEAIPSQQQFNYSITSKSRGRQADNKKGRFNELVSNVESKIPKKTLHERQAKESSRNKKNYRAVKNLGQTKQPRGTNQERKEKSGGSRNRHRTTGQTRLTRG